VDFEEGFKLAGQALDNGNALKALEGLVTATRR